MLQQALLKAWLVPVGMVLVRAVHKPIVRIAVQLRLRTSSQSNSAGGSKVTSFVLLSEVALLAGPHREGCQISLAGLAQGDAGHDRSGEIVQANLQMRSPRSGIVQ